MEVLSIKLPSEVRRRLAAEAKRRNMTQSAIVRESIEQLLKKSPGRGKPASCADLVRDLAGSVESGLSDLGTNKAYLEQAMLENIRRAAKRSR